MYSADEILSIAIQIEKNGMAFYREAARIQKVDEESKLMLRLAVEEETHAKTFVQMRESLDKGLAPFDLGRLQALDFLYIEAIADAHGGEGSYAAIDTLDENMTVGEVLTMAIGLEQKSILFYLGMKDAVSEHMGKSTVDQIINEEKTHIGRLQAELNKYNG